MGIPLCWWKLFTVTIHAFILLKEFVEVLQKPLLNPLLWIFMEILLFFSSCSFIFSCLFFNYKFLFQFEQFLISKFLSNDFWELLKVILIHTQVKVACHLNHSFLDFLNLLILGKIMGNHGWTSGVSFAQCHSCNLMGPLLYMQTVIDQNIMWYMAVYKSTLLSFCTDSKMPILVNPWG